jgi:hypothetical protein
MAVPLTDADLSAKLSRARADYQVRWHTVDQELYGLCQRRPSHRSFDDVYAKVTIIGRVYTAGVLRSSRAVGDREAEAARGIVQQAAQIDAALEALAGVTFGRPAAEQIIGLHGSITHGLLPHTGGRWLQSFVSKYLHFHCMLTPIFDSRAEARIGAFVDWTVAVNQTRAMLTRPPGSLTRYYNFATAFVTLAERVAAITGTAPCVKELDHLLWHAT